MSAQQRTLRSIDSGDVVSSELSQLMKVPVQHYRVLNAEPLMVQARLGNILPNPNFRALRARWDRHVHEFINCILRSNKTFIGTVINYHDTLAVIDFQYTYNTVQYQSIASELVERHFAIYIVTEENKRHQEFTTISQPSNYG